MKKFVIHPDIRSYSDSPGYKFSVQNHMVACYGERECPSTHLFLPFTDDCDCYVYPIPLAVSSAKSKLKYTSNDVILIDDHVIQSVKQNKTVLLFDCSSEFTDFVSVRTDQKCKDFLDSLDLCDYTYDIIWNTVRRYGLNKTNFVVTHANPVVDWNHIFPSCYLNIFDHGYDTNYAPVAEHIILERQRILNKEIRPKKVLSLVNKVRPSRIFITYEAWKDDLVKDNLMTIGVPNNRWNNISYLDKDFLSSLPWILGDTEAYTPSINRNWKPYSKALIPCYRDTYVNYVHESFDDLHGFGEKFGNVIFASEKIFFNMFLLKPFIVQGYPGTLKHLHDLGYKTFDKWWDESYDYSSGMERIIKTYQIFKMLSNMTHEELADMLYDMLPVLEHNLENYNYRKNNGVYVKKLHDILQTL